MHCHVMLTMHFLKGIKKPSIFLDFVVFIFYPIPTCVQLAFIMSSASITVTVSWSCILALCFLACVDSVLVVACFELATNPWASVLTIFKTYIYWLSFSESGVIWDHQVAVLEKCEELFYCYRDEDWVALFGDYFVSDYY